MIEAAMTESGTPGVAVGVIVDGQIIYVKGHGIVHRDMPTAAVDCRTRFHAASLSKPVVASALMTAFERGEMSETQTLADLVAGSNAHLLLTDLMTHTAGLRDRQRARARTSQKEKAEYFERALRQAGRATGAHRFRYTDVDYNLLGFAIEHRSGGSLQHFAHARIFGPLGMMDSSFALDAPGEAVTAWPHVGLGNTPASSHPHDIAFAPSSGLQTTAHDLVLFMQAYLDRDERLMARTSYDRAEAIKMTTQWEGISQSLVWQVATRAGQRVLQHGGSDKGFRSLITIYPESRAGIVMLANGEHFDRWTLRAQIERLIFDR
ncbi:serine hydrolase [Altererythrobacter arenosus]|uniref:Serine hydrolase n=1 Tax=Altererythrobacter arenosus TaxID=3032592 RepID=A0ABY8FRT4_9SPHN|nr:serine hydrolase domain-containing protein [Altererythrobacter sp. CAU 1644]WFL77724.1 serine hydrolase [Altererythrobacter sp. CAU 1644]